MTENNGGSGAAAETPVSIFGLASESDDILQTCLDIVKQGQRDIQALIEDYERRFVAWWQYLGVFSQPRSNLDFRLRKTPEIRNIVVRLLLVLRRNFAQCKPSYRLLATTLYISNHACFFTVRRCLESDEDITDGSSSYLKLALEAIDESLGQLSHVGISIRESSKTTETTRARRFVSIHHEALGFEAIAVKAIATLYPNAPMGLQSQLSRSIVDRYARIVYRAPRQDVFKTDTRKRHGVFHSTPNMLPSSTEQIQSQEILAGILSGAHVPQAQPTIDLTSIHMSVFRKRHGGMPLAHSRSDATTSILRDGQEPPVPQPDSAGKRTCYWCFLDLPASYVEDGKWTSIGR